ncbi:MAG: cell division protein ZapB [Bryobacteraceae bacterium]|jgi:predicted  nucleic acid-binding Zn-ribbon protein
MATPISAGPLREEDSLAGLEERIRRTLDLVSALRAERDAARQAAGTALSEMKKLRDEIEELRSERKQVRTRVEKLLGQMDLLAGS